MSLNGLKRFFLFTLVSYEGCNIIKGSRRKSGRQRINIAIVSEGPPVATAHPICLAPARAATAPVLTGDTQTRTAGHNSVLQQQGSEEQSNMFVDNCCKCLDTSGTWSW